jgi:membrane protease subunit HflC
VLVAEARAKADNLRGEGEAQASRTFAQAYSKDPGFFAAWRTLSAYHDAFAGGNAKLVLTPDNDFLHYLTTPPVPTAP